MRENKKTKVLQVVGGMNRGGVETWLMNVLKYLDRHRFQMDFLVHTSNPCAYDDDIRWCGSQVIPCMHPHEPLKYMRNFLRIMRNPGPYDVVHSHVHHFSGVTLSLAHWAGVPIRIAHSHNDTLQIQSRSKVLRRLYFSVMKRFIKFNSNANLAASRKAASALFGPDWEGKRRSKILYCSIDLARFMTNFDSYSIRKEFSLRASSFVVGHVGAFHEQKNHSFLIDIAVELARKENSFRLLLVGDGPLRSAMERKVEQFGLGDRVVFAGVRSDVPEIMKAAMDVFLMPSLHEGLPVAGIEAQAAGLPMVISDTVTPEVEIIPGLVDRVALSEGPSIWADRVLNAKNKKIEYVEAVSAMIKTPFNVEESVRMLERIYAGATATI